MAANPSIRIDLAAEFTGKKAFSQSEKAIDKLGKTLKRALIGGSLLALTSQAVKAFAEGEKAAALLANTLENLGFGMATKSVEAFISQLQLATGVSDSQLRPSMAKLVQSLGSVALAQDALTLAMDVSAASGISLDTVVSDIAQAYAGNLKGLKKYNLGLTALELKTMSVSEIMAKFNDIFGGGAAVAADTFAGKLARITTALDKAKGDLGQGIIDALMLATGSQDIEVLQQKIIDFGKYAGESIAKLGKVFNDFLPVIKTVGAAFAALFVIGKIQAGVNATIKILGGLTKAMKALRIVALSTAIAQAFVLNPLGGVAVAAGIIAIIAAVGVAVDGLDAKFDALGKKSTDFFNQTDGLKFGERFDLKKYKAAQAEEKKLAAEEKRNADALRKAEAKAAAERLKLAKQEAATKIKSEKLTKATAKFDITKIQIAAALKATSDKDERLRLLAMQEIENDNGEAALKYVDQLALLTKEQQTNKLAGITAISQSELDSINKILLDDLKRISSTKMTQEQADEARAEAYRKYNAAIIASGGLATANFYTEKTQIDLLKIARLAALDDVATAQVTYDILNYTTQTDIIARIAAAQALADNQKLQALRQYLAEQAGGNRSIFTPGMNPEQIADAATAAAAAAAIAAANAAADLADSLARFPQPSNGGPGFDSGGMFDYKDYMSPNPGSSSNTDITVVVEGSILDGNDFVEIVNGAMLKAKREGLSQFPAGAFA
jgi:hypothetical protein